MPQPAATVSCYGRWGRVFPGGEKVEQVRFLAPSGGVSFRPAFDYQAGEFKTDHHGYEELAPVGEPARAVRFTPVETGRYFYEALRGGEVTEAGWFECEASANPGYVQVSARDPRYFAYSNGEPYCAIGVNLCSVPLYPLPRGMEHFEAGNQTATLGLGEYRRWFRLLAENGGNFTRIWLSNPYLQTEGEAAGVTDALKFNRLDGLVELAREYGIRLKLCFDHFRAFHGAGSASPAVFLRRYVDPVSGREPASMDEWLSDPRWQELWFQKAAAYLARYGGDPVVMAWELWNEMDCVEGSWELVRAWTRRMLERIKAAEPAQLVTQSLGSFDDERKLPIQDDLRDMAEMDFQQVHRYLDQGAPWAICGADPVAFSIQAVGAARNADRPVLLAETGAVNDRHTGPFRYYRMDNRGILFHDTTFPAFFAGAAGSGHNWFWDSYVDQKNLWGQLRPLASLLEGVKLDHEGFQALDISNELAWCLLLRGQNTTLGWVRSKADTWQAVLRDGQEPPCYPRLHFSLPEIGAPRSTRILSGWPGEQAELGIRLEGGRLTIHNLRFGGLLRLDY